jgi:hypothetical protein
MTIRTVGIQIGITNKLIEPMNVYLLGNVNPNLDNPLTDTGSNSKNGRRDSSNGGGDRSIGSEGSGASASVRTLTSPVQRNTDVEPGFTRMQTIAVANHKPRKASENTNSTTGMRLLRGLAFRIGL